MLEDGLARIIEILMLDGTVKKGELLSMKKHWKTGLFKVVFYDEEGAKRFITCDGSRIMIYE